MSQNLMHEDFRRAGPMEAIGVALSRFAESLSPDGKFVKEGPRWICRPNNFVTFAVQPRKAGVLLTLRGTPAHFRERADAFGLRDEYIRNLDKDRAAYSRYPVRNPSQLLAASLFIKWAFERQEIKVAHYRNC